MRAHDATVGRPAVPVLVVPLVLRVVTVIVVGVRVVVFFVAVPRPFWRSECGGCSPGKERMRGIVKEKAKEETARKYVSRQEVANQRQHTAQHETEEEEEVKQEAAHETHAPPTSVHVDDGRDMLYVQAVTAESGRSPLDAQERTVVSPGRLMRSMWHGPLSSLSSCVTQRHRHMLHGGTNERGFACVARGGEEPSSLYLGTPLPCITHL
jgi:hypothetical protein